jgi:hypothetical protein
MRSTFRLLAGAAFFAALAVPAAAQCTPIAASGCGNQTGVVCGTQPRINTTFTWRCAPTCLTTNFTPFVIIGTPSTGTIPILPPLVCSNQACLLACDPIVIQQAPGNSIAIPNNQNLVGVELCIQCACVDRSVPCLSLTGAARVRILP